MIYTYQCPICRKLFRHGEKAEPCCTGPSESRDDHELTMMKLVKVDEDRVDPVLVAQTKPLVLPWFK